MPSILVDGPNLAFAAHFAAKERLVDTMGRPTGCIFGFLRMLKAIIDRVQTIYPGEDVRAIVAWDAPRSTLWRKSVLPSYKESRDTKQRTEEEERSLEEYKTQLKELRGILPMLGVGQIAALTMEADDIAGWLTRRGGKWVLVSGDHDWLQLVTEDVSVWQPTKGRLVIMENFQEVTGFSNTNDFVKMKAIVGDKGDDVPGAVGIGEKLAGKYLDGSLTGKRLETVTNWVNDPDGYERSLRLVDLRDVTIPLADSILIPGKLDEAAFSQVCINYNFASIFDSLNSWLEPFRNKQAGS